MISSLFADFAARMFGPLSSPNPESESPRYDNASEVFRRENEIVGQLVHEPSGRARRALEKELRGLIHTRDGMESGFGRVDMPRDLHGPHRN